MLVCKLIGGARRLGLNVRLKKQGETTVTFLETIGLISSFAGITGMNLSNLRARSCKTEFQGYIADLETRRVLYTEIGAEIKAGVLQSMQEILEKTRDILQLCASNKELCAEVKKIVRVIQEQQDNIRGYDENTPQGKYRIFMSLQKFRIQMARSLATICDALQIDPASTELKRLIIDLATVRPR